MSTSIVKKVSPMNGRQRLYYVVLTLLLALFSWAALLLPLRSQLSPAAQAVFTTGARAEVDICDVGEACSFDPDGTVSASAAAAAIINKTMLTVQQVRAAKDGLQETEILEP